MSSRVVIDIVVVLKRKIRSNILKGNGYAGSVQFYAESRIYAFYASLKSSQIMSAVHSSVHSIAHAKIKITMTHQCSVQASLFYFKRHLPSLVHAATA